MFCSISAIQPCVISYLGEFHCNRNRVKYISLTSVFGSSTILIQTGLGLLILTMDWKYTITDYFVFSPWRLYLLVINSLAVSAFILIKFLPESPKFLLTMNRKEEALSILNKIHSMNNGKDERVSKIVVN